MKMKELYTFILKCGACVCKAHSLNSLYFEQEQIQEQAKL